MHARSGRRDHLLLKERNGPWRRLFGRQRIGISRFSPPTQMSYYPAVCLKNASISVRFAAPFAHLPPDCLPLPQEETPVPAGPRSLLALILEPTRELAQQTFECLEHFRQYMSHPAVNVVRAGRMWDVGAADWRGTNRLEEAEEASGSQSHRGGDDEWAFHWGVK